MQTTEPQKTGFTPFSKHPGTANKVVTWAKIWSVGCIILGIVATIVPFVIVWRLTK